MLNQLGVGIVKECRLVYGATALSSTLFML